MLAARLTEAAVDSNIAGVLTYRNIVAFKSAGKIDETDCLVQEYIAGGKQLLLCSSVY